MTDQREIKDYTDTLQKIFNDMTITHKYKILGSASLKAIRYASDFDINEDIDGYDFKTLARKFKHIFKNAYIEPYLYITDFKAGVDDDNEPLRWSYDDIMRGRKGNITLEEALKMDAVVKLDMIAIVDNRICELSNNFFIKQKRPDPKKSLRDDIKELKLENNYFKALKRVFSLREVEKKSNKKLIDYFNTDVGLANKVKSDIISLIALLEQSFKPVSMKLVRHNIQIIKYELSGVSALNISAVFDGMMRLSKGKLLDKLYSVQADILELVNEDAKQHYAKLSR